MTKLQINEKGEREVKRISVSQALQIAGNFFISKPITLENIILNQFTITLFLLGRAGRYNTQWEHGYVTTFKRTDLPILTYLLSEKPEPIEQAGLHPTADQIELYAYHLPNASLSSLLVIEYNEKFITHFWIKC